MTTKWRTTLSVMPCAIIQNEDGCYWHPTDGYRLSVFMLKDTEKDAINFARKLRIAEIERLQTEINQLDERYDALEDIEMATESKNKL